MEYTTENLNIITGKYAGDLVNPTIEENSMGWEFWPARPITIEKVDINMEDDYNGNVEILLSNGHTIEYDCSEVRGGNCGPETKMSVSVSRPNECGYQICGNEYSDKYLSDYDGWVNGLMQCYSDYHRK